MGMAEYHLCTEAEHAESEHLRAPLIFQPYGFRLGTIGKRMNDIDRI